MKQRYKWHSYSDVHEREVEVPDDTVFIHAPGDIGTCLYRGFGHYLGGSMQTVEDGMRCDGLNRYKQFPGITLFSFSNVVFETDIDIIPAEEFYSRFDIGSYYIFYYTRYKADYQITNEGDMKVLTPKKIFPASLVSASKIINIRSQYLVDVMTCTVGSWIRSDDRDVKEISLSKSLHLFNLLDDNFNNVVVRKDCDEEYTDMMNQVLGIVGKKVED